MIIKIPPLIAMSTYSKGAKTTVTIEVNVRTLYIEDNIVTFQNKSVLDSAGQFMTAAGIHRSSGMKRRMELGMGR